MLFSFENGILKIVGKINQILAFNDTDKDKPTIQYLILYGSEYLFLCIYLPNMPQKGYVSLV